MPNRRLFLAIPPSPTAEFLLEDFQAQLKKSGLRPTECRWIPKQNFHLTVHFLGNTEERTYSLLLERLRQHDFGKKHTFIMDELVAFPQFTKARVAGVGKWSEQTPLHELHQGLVGLLDALGFSLEHHDYTPHITLVRFTYPQNCNFLKLKVPKIEFPIEKIALYESQLKESGSVYTILKEFPLT